jgi:hypothetical protein
MLHLVFAVTPVVLMLFRAMQYSLAHHYLMRDGENGRCTYQYYNSRLFSDVNSDEGKVNINKLKR